jgi:undecaprenyl-diphosphatase
MDYLIISILALIQGTTEFLPVSSSGHLVLAQRWLHWDIDNVLLDAVLHLGTAAAICVIYRKEIRTLVGDALSKDVARRKPSLKYVGLIILAAIPAGLAGVVFKGFFEKMFLNARAAGALFFVTAAFLFASGLRKKPAIALNRPKALVIGLVQALAILPGVSRSGTTISTALLLGMDRKEAGRFSFLLGLPIIVGAALLELKDVSGASISPGLLAVAFGLSAAVGIIALKLLLRIIEQGRLHYFGYYLVALGLACVLFL